MDLTPEASHVGEESVCGVGEVCEAGIEGSVRETWRFPGACHPAGSEWRTPTSSSTDYGSTP